MKRPLAISTLALSLSGWGHGDEERTGGFADTLARWCSKDVREADARLLQLGEALAKLPSLEWTQESSRHGFHSLPTFEQNDPQWIQLDLEHIVPIDMIVVMGADVRSPSRPGEAHGFPLRFRVEVGSQPDLSDAVIIADESAEDFPNPGRFPLVYEQPGRQARYVRFTSLKHCPTRDGDFNWALGEVMVLSGNRNVALEKHVEASEGGLELGPNWMLMAINDGHSTVGTPVSAAPSPTYGYRSSRAEHDGARRWVSLDLGKSYPLDEVRLVPAWPSTVAYEAGMGFPEAFRVLLSNDPNFRRSVVLNRFLRPANPRNNPCTIPANGQRGRYLRLEANRLWKRADLRLLALSEIQAFSAGKNVARGSKVVVSDAVEGEDLTRWAPEYLVDGYSSKAELVSWPEYFKALVERAALETERAGLVLERNATARRVGDTLIVTGSVAAGLALVTLLLVLVKQRITRRRDQEALRAQIARDLHDELGSNLGSISLLSELGSRLEGLPREVRRDLVEIHRTAEHSAEAVRDIVWLIDSGSCDLADLLAKMREAAERFGGDHLTLKVLPEDVPDVELPILFRRHILFSFKETLNNVRRHAKAGKVDVTIDCRDESFLFVIQDDGVGFHVDERRGLGHGLENLTKRAEKLHGQCQIFSRPAGGTTVRFQAPLKRHHSETFGRKKPSMASGG